MLGERTVYLFQDKAKVVIGAGVDRGEGLAHQPGQIDLGRAIVDLKPLCGHHQVGHSGIIEVHTDHEEDIIEWIVI